MARKLLSVRNLKTSFFTHVGEVKAVRGISFDVNEGEVLGIVGESGSGKSVTSLSIMGLLQYPGRVVDGEILLNGEDILTYSKNQMRRVRGKEIAMIFQDPMTSLNPVLTVGEQIAEAVENHERCGKARAMERAEEMLELVGIPAERVHEYPHQFSGGMKQRVVIAIALACNPKMLIADEPTTALDVTIQAQVLEMMQSLKRQLNTSMLLITHDLGVVAQNCDRVAVIYAGEIVEYGTVMDVFKRMKHPYTQGLFSSIPQINADVKRLNSIPGLMLDPTLDVEGCRFCDRCKYATEECRINHPELVEIESGHSVRCFQKK